MKLDQQIIRPPVQPAVATYGDKTAIIIGGTGGLGRAISQRLALLGVRIVVVGQTFRDEGVENIEFVQADLSLLRHARRIADLLPAEVADMIVFTTGIFAAPEREVTSEGIERDMAVSFLNRLVMLRAMAPRLGANRSNVQLKPRIFVMGHPGTGQAGNPQDLNSESQYKGFSAHMNTVAGNEALVIECARQYPMLEIFGLNPGIVKTAIRSNFLGKGSLKHRFAEWIIGIVMQSPDRYAGRIAPFLMSPELSGFSGAMFNNKGLEILPSSKMTDSYATSYIIASETLAMRAGDVIHGAQSR